MGLTGGIGSGKSTVTRWLRQQAGDQLTVVDADEVARDVVAPGCALLPELQAVFGADIVDDQGALRRSVLAQRAFGSPETTEQLNQIMHPAIRAEIAQRLQHAHTPYVLLDHPLLIETGAHELVDQVLVVHADPEVRLQRLVQFRDFDPEDVRQRMQRQLGEQERLDYADVVFDNNGTEVKLQAQVESWWRGLTSTP